MSLLDLLNIYIYVVRHGTCILNRTVTWGFKCIQF